MPEQTQSGDERVGNGMSWKFVATFLLSSAIPLLSAAAYLIGLAYRTTYHHEFNIPSGLLAATTSDYLVYAYTALAETGIRLIGFTGLTVMSLPVVAVLTWKFFSWAERKAEESQRLRRVRANVNSSGFLKLIGYLCAILTSVAALSYLALFSYGVFLTPYILGEKAGKQRAIDDASAYELGCEKGSGGARFCIDIYHDEKIVASGFVVDSSDKYLAVYENGTVRILPTEGMHFLSKRIAKP